MYSKLSFTCDKCNSQIHEEILVQDTNMDDEEGVFSEEILDCPVCGKTFELSINNKGGLVLVVANGVPLEHGAASSPDLISDHNISDFEEDYLWYLSISQQTVYQYFLSSIASLRCMININFDNRHQDEVFNRMLLVQSIASMEAYLSDTLIARVITDQVQLKRLFLTDKTLKQEKYSAAAFLDDKDFAKKKAKEYLSDLVYHNLPKIDVLYQNILGIEFDYGDNNSKDELFLAIHIRHDCVHRNGKTKEGSGLNMIDKEYISNVLEIIEQFVSKIEKPFEEEFDDDIPF